MLHFKLKKAQEKRGAPTVLMPYPEERRSQRKEERKGPQKKEGGFKRGSAKLELRREQWPHTSWLRASTVQVEHAMARRTLQMVKGSRDFSQVPLLEKVILGRGGILLLIDGKKQNNSNRKIHGSH